MRRERRGGDADAEAPQAFKEGASTLRNAQNRIHISCSAAAWGVDLPPIIVPLPELDLPAYRMVL